MEPVIAGAVIGCGRMGAFTSPAVRRYAPSCWLPLSHCEAIDAHPRLELRALCDLDAELLDRAARAFDVSEVFTDYRQLIDQAGPTLLAIATRTIGRAAIIEYGIAHGVRALHVEKPLCSSVAELNRLSQLLAGEEVFLTFGAIRRHFQVYALARELALSGKFGRLQEIRVKLGRGSLYWVHPHSVDLILFVAGDLQVVGVQSRLADVTTGTSATLIESDPIVESASIYFSGGVAGHVTCAPGADLVISCSAGEIVVENDGADIRVSAPVGDNPYPQWRYHEESLHAGSPEGTYSAIAHLCRCLDNVAADRQANRLLRQDVLLGQQILFAMVQSHLERSRIVQLGEVDPGIVIHAMTGGRYA